MTFPCPICGEELEDPGVAFLDHVRERADCREAYEHGSDSTAEEWSKR